MTSSEAEQHNAYQQQYYRSEEHPSIRPIDTAYVRRHRREVLSAVGADAAMPLLEVGAGSGRQTLPLLREGYAVTAVDLSEELLGQLAAGWQGEGLTTLSGDIAELWQKTAARFDRAVGFFVLHHLYDLERAFGGLRRLLNPGARIAFCEPNAFNPLFYLQLATSRTMTWAGDGGMTRMRRSVLVPALSRAGFVDLELRRYGMLPPQLYNRALGCAVDHALGSIGALEAVRAFVLVSGRVPR